MLSFANIDEHESQGVPVVPRKQSLSQYTLEVVQTEVDVDHISTAPLLNHPIGAEKLLCQ